MLIINKLYKFYTNFNIKRNRSTWKPYIKITKENNNRNIIIYPNLVNKVIKINNGRSNKDLKITNKHLNLYSGELYITKKIAKYKGAK